jgi:hypothetical protein
MYKIKEEQQQQNYVLNLLSSHVESGAADAAAL